MKYLAQKILLLVLLTATLLQGNSFRKTGTVGYTFLELPAMARQAALGDAVGAVADGGAVLSLFANPGVLGLQNGWHFGAEYSPWLAEIQHNAVGLVIPAGLIGNFGISVNMVDFGKMTHTGTEGHVLGTYTAQSLALGITYSRRLTDKFSWGIRLNGIREEIHTFISQNVLVDMGIYYLTGFNSLRIAGYINHFGVDGKFIRDSFKMPTALRLGIAYDLWNTPRYRLTTAVELSHTADNLERLHVALEQLILKRFYVRSAFKTPVNEDPWSFGVGIHWGKIRVDAGVIPFGRFPAVYSFGIQVTP
ncbi:MAG: PorV/PorQ family protein [Candidatus Marinimicrobia bacterium]|nr:PorV/PorQ family protein [Candidatus Neomarinimicrobiota bacterium]